MTDIERLRDQLADQFPDHPLRLTKPYLEAGFWNLNLERRADLAPVVIEWKANLGFGVSTPEDGDFGVGADEIYPNIDSAHERIVELILSDGVTDGHPDALKKSLPL